MNYFNRSRTIILLLSLLLIISITSLATILYRQSNNVVSEPATCANSVEFLTKELGLTNEQKDKLSQIRTTCQQNSTCIMREMKSGNEELLTELNRENPDTVILDSIAREIGMQQEMVIHSTIKQYLSIKDICTADQKEKLSELYFELLGCGSKHQARHGRGHNGGRNCK